MPAISSGVAPRLFSLDGSAPRLRSSFTQLSRENPAERCRGVVPAGVDGQSTGTPASRRHRSTGRRPHRAATCSEVKPCSFFLAGVVEMG